MTTGSGKCVIGVDLGGTHVSAGVVSRSGKILGRADVMINADSPAQAVITEDIVGTITRAIAASGVTMERISGIGMGLPGNLDSRKGLVLFSPNLNWRQVQVREPVEKAYSIPTFILNDVRCATMGEWHFGNGRGVSDLVCMAIGTGIGGGIVANNRLVLGMSEGAGEIGHQTIYPDGPICNCGNRGCMEALAAGPSIARRAREALEAGRNSIIGSLAGASNQVSARVVGLAAQEGDPLALEIWEETGRIIGIGLSQLVSALNPARILVGGRVALSREFFLPAVKREIESRCHLIPPGSTELLPFAFTEDAGLVGAAALALTRLGLT